MISTSGSAESQARRPGGIPADVVAKAGSWRWKVLAALVLLAGCLACLLAVSVILQIDGAANADHFNTAQDVVGVTATFVGFGGLIAVLVYTVSFARRPALAVSDDHLYVFNLRPLGLAWTMVKDVRTGQRRRLIPVVRATTIDLVGGGTVIVRFGRSWLRSEPDSPPLPRRAADAIEQRLQRPTSGLRNSDLAAGLPRRSRELPEQPLAWGPDRSGERRKFLAPAFAAVLVVAGPVAGIQSGSGHRFYMGQYLLALGAVATSAILLGLAAWSRSARRLAVGPGWVAWRPRGFRRWRILSFGDIASTWSRSARVPGLTLKRADGTGVLVRFRELTHDVQIALDQQLSSHPALDRQARGLLALPPFPSGSAAKPNSVQHDLTEPSGPVDVEERQRWRIGRLGRVSMGLAELGIVALFAGLVATDTSNLPGAIVVVGVVSLFSWRGVLAPYIEVTKAALVVRNPLRRWVIPWEEIVDVRPGYSGLTIQRVTKSPIVAWAVQKMNISVWLGWRTRADDVSEAINDYRQQRVRHPDAVPQFPADA